MDADAELLHALVRGFDRAMLVTRCGRALRARPTTIAHAFAAERLWLLSAINGDPLDELGQDPDVNVVMQDETRFCSVSGTARIARTSGEESIWSDEQREWLAHGARRSGLLLIEVSPRYAECWDRGGLRGVRFDARDGASEGPRASGRVAVAQGGASRGALPDNVIFVEQERWKRKASSTF